MPGDWVAALIAAGAVPASLVPEASAGRSDATEVTGADVVEGERLRVHPLDAPPLAPGAVTFLDGIQRWSVVGYDGVTPIVRAYVAAAARRRGAGRRLETVEEAAEECAITAVRALRPEVLAALRRSAPRVIDLDDVAPGQPGRALAAAQVKVDRMREAVEHTVAERVGARLGADEWLVVDGIISDSETLARHPRVVGVVKSHGAQYFSGAELERALTLPHRHRTSVFRPTTRHGQHPVYSWYVRLWPWEGNDLLYGLVRVEARAEVATLSVAGPLGAWLHAERAPLSTPDARFDRLLYPIHLVEEYLKARAPRGQVPGRAARLPRTGS
ncbi:MAG TPA: hypothetical protein VI160_00200 [Gemmatimonadales bacterium]